MKHRGRWSLLLPLCTFLIATALPATARASVHQILWGRCYAYCLKHHLVDSSQEPESALTEDTNGIQKCQRNAVCKWCLYVCERPEANYAVYESCMHDCQNTRTHQRSMGRQACVDACGFLARSSGVKTGKCPPSDTLKGFESACINTCHNDDDCPNAEKCCPNGCGSVCTRPLSSEILPPVPANISFKLLQNGGVLVTWKQPMMDEGRSVVWPVIYILRWWCPYTDGALTFITDKTRTKVQGYPTGIYPGSKCHFMVASVNIHGSRGFSKVSPYIKRFLPPSPPLHLDKVESTLVDNRVNVKIQWQPPLYTDGLPVFQYLVFWSDSLPKASPTYMRLHMHKRTLSADHHSFILYSLHPGTIYFVQVRAVVKWQNRKKRGQPASTYIETYSPPQTAPNGQVPGVVTSEGKESDILSLTVNQTYYHGTILKAFLSWKLKPGKRAMKYLIYWKPESCASHVEQKNKLNRLETSATSHDKTFILYNLLHECEYIVRVHPVNTRHQTGSAMVTSFQTLPCHQTPVVDVASPECDKTEPPGQVRGLHSETTDCLTVIRWQEPTGHKVENYTVVWGESDAGPFSSSTVIFSSRPEELSVPGNWTSADLGHLNIGQHYTVQVTAISQAGQSLPSILHITIPRPSSTCKGGTGSTAAASHTFNSTTHPSESFLFAGGSSTLNTSSQNISSGGNTHPNSLLTDFSMGTTMSSAPGKTPGKTQGRKPKTSTTVAVTPVWTPSPMTVSVTPVTEVTSAPVLFDTSSGDTTSASPISSELVLVTRKGSPREQSPTDSPRGRVTSPSESNLTASSGAWKVPTCRHSSVLAISLALLLKVLHL